MSITYGSVCSGIEAASVAWEPLGWTPLWFSEIEPFPSAVLAHRWPAVQNLGDMTQVARLVLERKIPAPDGLVAGTPCQAFSVAGMREGLDDPRGALTIKLVELFDAIDHVRAAAGKPPAFLLWENVPGVLSSRDNAFGCFLGALVGETGALEPAGRKWTNAGSVYGPARAISWRVLDAQYFGLAQRRRRVFVVASARAGLDPGSVLFEFEGLRRDTPPSREARQAVAGTLESRSSAGGFPGTDGACSGHVIAMAHGQAGAEIGENRAPTLTCNHEAPIVVHGTQDPVVSRDRAHALGRNHGGENAVFDPNQITSPNNRSAPRPEVCHTLPASSQPPIAFSCKDFAADAGEVAPTLRSMGHSSSHPNAGGQVAVCITGEITHTLKAEGFDASEDGTGRGQPIVSCREVAQTLTSNYGKQPDNTNSEVGPNVVATTSAVRRLTPRECERLMGFPDDYTLIPWRGRPAHECPDGPRYKALGNSKAVPVVRWIGERIERVLKSFE